MSLVTLQNVKLKKFDRSLSMPLYEKKKPEEFQKVRDSIRKRTFSLHTSQKPPSTSEDSRTSSLSSVTSSPTQTSSTADWRQLELRRTRSHSLSSNSRTSFDIPPLRSSARSTHKQNLQELKQAEEMLEVCKEISKLTQEFAADYEELSRDCAEIPDVCLNLERYASDILIHLGDTK
ncbi:hypothetical protein ACHWQZ_G016532 [Mnemiopsis leidyi]